MKLKERISEVNLDYGHTPTNVFDNTENRWEAGSRGLMILMQFSLEALKQGLEYGQGGNLIDCANHVDKSSKFVAAGATLMKTFGNIGSKEYDKFRETRDVHGSQTDKIIIDLHIKQKVVMKDVVRLYLRTLAEKGIKTKPIDESKKMIEENGDILQLTKALILANETHKDVFIAHRYVCQKVVGSGKPSLRGNHIEMFQNRDFLPLLSDLRDAFGINIKAENVVFH